MAIKDGQDSLTTGRRIWLWTSVVISRVILVLAVSSTVGIWIGRNLVIQVADGILNGVYDLATVGRDGLNRLNGTTTEIHSLTTEMESTVTELGQSVSGRGVIITILPPEKLQKGNLLCRGLLSQPLSHKFGSGLHGLHAQASLLL